MEAWVTEGALVRGGGLLVLTRAKGLLVKEGRAGLQVTQKQSAYPTPLLALDKPPKTLIHHKVPLPLPAALRL